MTTNGKPKPLTTQEEMNLIAQASNVYNQTGLMPRELVIQRDSLQEACRVALAKLESIGCYDNKEYFVVKNALSNTEVKS